MLNKPNPNIITFTKCWLQRELFIDSLPADFPERRLRACTREEMDLIALHTFAYRVGWLVHPNSPHVLKTCECYPKPKPINKEQA
jgi:hypothetical protein